MRWRIALIWIGLLGGQPGPALGQIEERENRREPTRHTVTVDDGHPVAVWETRPPDPTADWAKGSGLAA